MRTKIRPSSASGSQSMEGGLKILGPPRGKTTLTFGARMDKGEFMGVEQNPRRLIACQIGQTMGRAPAVGVVAGDGESEVLEVHADLVGAARMQRGFDEGRMLQPFDDPV